MINSFFISISFIFTTIVAQAASGGHITMHPVQSAKDIANAAVATGAMGGGCAAAQGSRFASGVVTTINTLEGADSAGNIAEGGIDMLRNGVNGQNVKQVVSGVLGLIGLKGRQCFTEGTQIVVGAIYDEELCTVEYVTANIESIKVGDYVLAQDVETGEVSLKEVTDTFVRTADHIRYLTTIDEEGDEQIIETTDAHPFRVVTDNPDLSRAAGEFVVENGTILYHENLAVTEHGYYVEAKDLKIGDVFLGANGELSTLVSTERVEYLNGITVYNFTVADNHNYFVIAEVAEFGQTCILVHNAGYGNLKTYNDGKIKNMGYDPHSIKREILGEKSKDISKYNISVVPNTNEVVLTPVKPGALPNVESRLPLEAFDKIPSTIKINRQNGNH